MHEPTHTLFGETFRRALLVADGDPTVFMTRPGAAILLALNAALVLSQVPPVRRGLRRLVRRGATTEG